MDAPMKAGVVYDPMNIAATADSGIRIDEVRESLDIAARSGMKSSLRNWTFVPGTDPFLRIVGICAHKDMLIVATEAGVYRLEGDTLKPLKFEVKP